MGGPATSVTTRSAETAAKGWNVVATLQPGEFRRGCRILEQFGDVDPTGFYNVVVVTVDDPRAMLRDLLRQAADRRGLLDILARVMPADVTFNFTSPEEFHAKAREVALSWAASLAGSSFHVRLHRRGFKGRLSTQSEERFLDDLVLAALAATGTPGQIDFDDPDAVIDIETVGNRAGMSLWTRADLTDNPFLRID
jgi:tRNA(Ser,Leu) C12 N-acetylase TAN1